MNSPWPGSRSTAPARWRSSSGSSSSAASPPAARALRMTPSAVSKLIARLESAPRRAAGQPLDAQAPAHAGGPAFYERAVRILADHGRGRRERGRGRRAARPPRVNSNVPFGAAFSLPLLPRFLERHPEVTLDLVLTDHVDRPDGGARRCRHPRRAAEASQLVARKLGDEPHGASSARPTIWRASARRRRRRISPSHNRHRLHLRPRIRDGWPFRRGDRHRGRHAATGTRRPATAKSPAASPSAASASPACPSSISAPTSNRAVSCRCWRTTIPATGRHPRRLCRPPRPCPRGCGRSSIFSPSMCG